MNGFVTNQTPKRSAKTQIHLCIIISLCAHLTAEDLNFIHADSNESDQIKRMRRLILDFMNIRQRLSDLSSIRCP